MPQVEFYGQSSRDGDNTHASSARLINFYRERVDGKPIIKGVLGTQAFATLPAGKVFCRAMATIGGTIYVVQGGTLYSITSRGDVVEIGAVADSENTSISGNNGKVTVAAGGRYFVWNGTAISEPAAGAFSAFGDVTFFGQRTVLSEDGGRRVQWSAVADPSTLDGLAFATAEARDDDILRLLPLAGQLWVFKEASIEQWYDTGTDLTVRPGAVLDTGLKARNLLVGFPNGAFFIGTDGKAYIAAGAAVRPVSTVGVETALAQDEPARVFYYQDEGHEFCVITFPRREAWVYDLAVNEWHERGEGTGPWDARASVGAYGAWFVGTDTGGVQKLARVSTDVSGPLVRRAIGATLENGGGRFRVASFRMTGRVGWHNTDPSFVDGDEVLGLGGDDVLEVETDTALLIAEGRAPRELLAELAFSSDTGHTWSQPYQVALGRPGKYGREIMLRGLGQYRQFTPQLTVSEPYDVSFAAVATIGAA